MNKSLACISLESIHNLLTEIEVDPITLEILTLYNISFNSFNLALVLPFDSYLFSSQI